MNASAVGDRSLYFAYGSNLCANRMLERVPSARVIAPARVDDRQLSLGKQGRDGSGKRVATGIYFYRLDIGSWSSTRKLLKLQ